MPSATTAGPRTQYQPDDSMKNTSRSRPVKPALPLSPIWPTVTQATKNAIGGR